MMRVRGGELFESDQADEFIDLCSLFVENTASDKASFDIAADGEPGKKIGILKDEAAFSTGTGNRFAPDP
jgi:hypothetical protein